jgi:hypothetical protein
MTDAVLPELAGKTPLTSRGFGWLQMVGRLAPGATVQQAQAQLDAVAAARHGRRADATRRGPWARALPAVDAALDPSGGGRTTRLAWLLFGIVACVLLLACADAAGLLVVRAEERKREVAIRRASEPPRTHCEAVADREPHPLRPERARRSRARGLARRPRVARTARLRASARERFARHRDARPLHGVVSPPDRSSLGTVPMVDRSRPKWPDAQERSAVRFGDRRTLPAALRVRRPPGRAIRGPSVGAGFCSGPSGTRTAWTSASTRYLLVGSVDVGKQDTTRRRADKSSANSRRGARDPGVGRPRLRGRFLCSAPSCAWPS